MFEANAKGQLEIHSGSMASSILEDTIPCARLVIDQADDEVVEAIIGPLDLATDNMPSSLPAMQSISG